MDMLTSLFVNFDTFNVEIQHCRSIYTNPNSKKVGIYFHLKTEHNDLQISKPIFGLQKKMEIISNV